MIHMAEAALFLKFEIGRQYNKKHYMGKKISECRFRKEIQSFNLKDVNKEKRTFFKKKIFIL